MSRSFLDLARELADIRKAHATEFLYQRMMSKTDNQARAGADERYIHDLTMAEARYELARVVLSRTDLPDRVVHEIRRAIEESYEHPRPDTDDQSSTTDTDDEGPDKDCAD